MINYITMELLCPSCINDNELWDQVCDYDAELCSLQAKDKDSIHDKEEPECLRFCKLSWDLNYLLRKCGEQHNYSFALAKSLHLLLDVLRINPCIHCCTYFLELRFHVPFLMLNLGMDQVCYDFVRWSIQLQPVEQAFILSSSEFPKDPWPWAPYQNVMEDPIRMQFDFGDGFESDNEFYDRILFALPIAIIKLRNVKRIEGETLEKMWSFLMVTHDRLGSDSPFNGLKSHPIILQRIVSELKSDLDECKAEQFHQVFCALKMLAFHHRTLVEKVVENCPKPVKFDIEDLARNETARFESLFDVAKFSLDQTPRIRDFLERALVSTSIEKHEKQNTISEKCAIS